MTTTKNFAGARWQRSGVFRPLALTAALLVPLAACELDSILDVEDPDVVGTETARDPMNVAGLRAGALGDFMVAYAGNTLGGGGTEGVVLSAGLLADELYVSDTFGTRQEVDQRRIADDNAGMTTVFRNLHRARRLAEIAAETYAANPDHERYSAVGHAEVTSLAGYTYLMFAQNWCSGVPFSHLADDGRVVHGPQRTTAEMLSQALDFFREAQSLTTNATQLNLARLGEGRTLLAQGQFAAAAAAVEAVPTSYVYELQYSENTARQNNGVWGITHNRRGYGVSHLEGGNGLPFRQGSSQQPATQDPRVPYTRTNLRAIDSPYSHFFQLRFPARGSAMPFATGIEARLIEAEAALQEGDVGTFVDKHNEIRATWGLSAFNLATVEAMTPAQRVDLHFQERGFWLFLTAQRLDDMRRLVRQYGRNSESVFPSGPYRRLLFAPATGTGALPDEQLPVRTFNFDYGTDVNFPIPFDEQNNPNFEQCLNRNA